MEFYSKMTTLDNGKADADEEEHWLFFGLDEEEVKEYTALRDDISEWLHTSLWEWVKDAFTIRPYNVNPIRQQQLPSHFDNKSGARMRARAACSHRVERRTRDRTESRPGFCSVRL